MSFHLMRPEWLWAAVPALVLGVLLWRERRARGSWQSVISADLLPFLMGEQAGTKNRNYLPLVLLAWLLASIAAAGPSWQKIPQPIHQKQDALVVLLDLSYSMKSADLAPSRIDRARQKLLDLLAGRREGQTGLIAFAGDSHIVTPLTDDTQTIANLLPALHPDMMPVPGSDPASAVAQGLDLLHSAGIRRGNMLLVTDAIAAADATAITQILQGQGVQLGVMGIGTHTGAPVPLPDGGFLRDRAGAIVMPGLDESTLRELAVDNGGRYMRMTIDDGDLAYLVIPPAAGFDQQTLALDRQANTWDDQGYLLILPLLPLVLLLFRRGWLLGVLPLALVLQADPATAQTWDDLWFTRDQQGQRALQQGEAGAAADLFENPGWAGAAAYEDGDYERSAEHFNTLEDADSQYNLGNALARSGRIDEAIEAYKASLERQPGRTDAEENLALLEQLKQQAEQQQQSQQEQQSGDGGEQEEQSQAQDGDQSGDSQSSESSQEHQSSQQQQGQSGEQSERDNDAQQQGQPGEQDTAQDHSKQANAGSEEQDEAGEESGAPSQAQAGQDGQDSEDGEQGASQALAQGQEQQELDQAMEQWLRRVPDDPSGLLREKFRHESQMRRDRGARRDNEQYW